MAHRRMLGKFHAYRHNEMDCVNAYKWLKTSNGGFYDELAGFNHGMIYGTCIAVDGVFMESKPLFIPLKTEYYESFERGAKPSELRVYGKRWNEKRYYVANTPIQLVAWGHMICKSDCLPPDSTFIPALSKADATNWNSLESCESPTKTPKPLPPVTKLVIRSVAIPDFL